MKSNQSNVDSVTDSLVDKYLDSDSKKPLVGRLVGSETSTYGADVVPAVNYGPAGPIGGSATPGIDYAATAVSVGASDVVYGPTEPVASLVPGPVGIDDSLPDALTNKFAYNDLDVDFLLPSPDRVSQLIGIKKPENPEFVPQYFEQLPDNVDVSILNANDYIEWSLLPESYEVDFEKPMWR